MWTVASFDAFGQKFTPGCSGAVSPASAAATLPGFLVRVRGVAMWTVAIFEASGHSVASSCPVASL